MLCNPKHKFNVNSIMKHSGITYRNYAGLTFKTKKAAKKWWKKEKKKQKKENTYSIVITISMCIFIVGSVFLIKYFNLI